jgi:uncharacterized RDD family membrane protein YckC
MHDAIDCISILGYSPYVETSKRGTYYAARDYAGLLRRLLMVLVDSVVLGLVFIILALISASAPVLARFFWLTYFATWYLYMAVLKSTSLGTIGYRVAGVRLVTLSGQTPSLWQTTCRMGFLILGPFNLLLDLILLQAEPDRQTLRDKITGTFVIRRNAVPAGHGAIHYRKLFWMAWCLTIPEVARDKENSDL